MRREFRSGAPFSRAAVAALVVLCVTAFAFAALRRGAGKQETDSLSKVLGEWEGESVCVDKNRPACKNEHVVYHLTKKAEEHEGESYVTMRADKIVNGKPEDMGTLDCKYDDGKKTLTCEFTVNGTHGVFEYEVKGDEMEGALRILPAGTLGRRIHVKKIPPAAAPSN